MIPKEKSEFNNLISATHIKVNGTKYTLLSVDSQKTVMYVLVALLLLEKLRI